MAGPGSRNGSNRGGRNGNQSGGRGGGTGGNQRGGARGDKGRGSNSSNQSRGESNNGSQGGGRNRGGKRGVGAAASTANNRSSGAGGRSSRDNARSAMNSTHPVERAIARTQKTSTMTPQEQSTELGKGGQTPNSQINGVTDRAISGSGVSPREMDMAVDAVDAYNDRFAANRTKDALSLSGVNTVSFGLANKAVDALSQPKNTYGAAYGYQRAEDTQMPGISKGLLGITNATGLTSVPTALANHSYSLIADSMMNQDMHNTVLSDDAPSRTPSGNGSETNQITNTEQVASVTPSSNAKQAFGWGKVDPDQYSKGLMNAKV